MTEMTESKRIERFVVTKVIEDTNFLQVPSFRPHSPIPRSGSLSLSVRFSSDEEIIPRFVGFEVLCLNIFNFNFNLLKMTYSL